MADLTVRNIPEAVMNRIRVLSTAERRSLNNEILVLIESGLERENESPRTLHHPPGAEVQARLWEALCGRWEDSRPAAAIAKDIRRRRTAGRRVDL